jgi:hypothetical protein
MNGTNLADQKAIAKTLIKLRLSAGTASVLAAATGVDSTTLTNIATAINNASACPVRSERVILGRPWRRGFEFRG